MTEAPAPRKPSDFQIPEEWADEKTVILAGQKWAVAPMTGRTIAKFTSKAVGVRIGMSILQGDDEEKVERDLEKVYRLVHLGLLRAYPDLTFDEFFDMTVTPDELFEAFPVVAASSGLELKQVNAGEAPAAPQTEKTPSADLTTSSSE